MKTRQIQIGTYKELSTGATREQIDAAKREITLALAETIIEHAHFIIHDIDYLRCDPLAQKITVGLKLTIDTERVPTDFYIPASVGETAYCVRAGGYEKVTVYGIGNDRISAITPNGKMMILHGDCYGETLFRSEEEAKEAIRPVKYQVFAGVEAQPLEGDTP